MLKHERIPAFIAFKRKDKEMTMEFTPVTKQKHLSPPDTVPAMASKQPPPCLSHIRCRDKPRHHRKIHQVALAHDRERQY